ncbi:MAG: PLD nuclease N-terminal domain-containing protein [Candidatus Methanoperedens sp.]
MIGVSEIILILFIPVFVFVIVLWFWMLIDCLKRPDDTFKFGGNNAKLIWILVIIFTGLIGALIYYFLIKRTDSHQDRLIGIALLASVVIVIILIASNFVATTKTTVSIEPYPSGKLPQSTPSVTMNGTIENITIPCPFNVQCNPQYWLDAEDGNTYNLHFSPSARLPNFGQHIEVIGIETNDTNCYLNYCENNGTVPCKLIPCQPIGIVNVSNWQPR